MLSSLLAIFLIKNVSYKKAYLIAYSACVIAGVLVMSVERKNVNLIPVGVLLAKLGIGVAFSYLYFSVIEFFPSQYCGFVFGFCNTIGRTFSILAPMAAEATEPVPMLSMIIVCSLSLLATFRLVQPKVEE